MNRFYSIPLIVCIISTGLLFNGCQEDEPISITITDLEINEGYPYQKFMIYFDNPSLTKFEVYFADKSVPPNNVVVASNGNLVEIPLFDSEQEVEIVLKVNGNVFLATSTFKVKPLPKITYVSSNKCGFRLPLKVVVTNLDYYNPGRFTFCGGPLNSCYDPFFTISGDTIIVKPSTTYSNNTNYLNGYTFSISGNPPYASSERAPTKITGSSSILFRPTYHFDKYSGKEGDTFGVIFDNALYFADDMTLKIGTTIIEPDFVNIAGGVGYLNALYGAYTIPTGLPPGVYDISITDPNNMEYLPEISAKFTIQ